MGQTELIFGYKKNFVPAFFDHFSNMMDQKNAPSQKKVNIKNSFYMPVNHVKEYLLTLVSYFYNYLPELQTTAGNPILRIDV